MLIYFHIQQFMPLRSFLCHKESQNIYSVRFSDALRSFRLAEKHTFRDPYRMIDAFVFNKSSSQLLFSVNNQEEAAESL